MFLLHNIHACASQAHYQQTVGAPRHTYDVTLWLSRTTDNSNFFIESREVRDNERRLYIFFNCFRCNLSFVNIVNVCLNRGPQGRLELSN